MPNAKQSNFISAFAVGTDARELVNLCVRDLGDISATANFGFIYASDALANQLPRLMSLLADATSVQQWCGTLATGIFCNDLEIYDQPAIAILLCEFSDNSWHTFAYNPEKPELAKLNDNFVPNFGVVYADPNNLITSEVITKAQQESTPAHLVGGLTLSQTQPLQIAGNRIYDGVSGVLFNNSIPVLTEITQACSPIGRFHKVTSTSNNRVVGLDKQPALNVLIEEAGEFLSNDLERLREYVCAGIATAESNLGADEYLVRDLLTFDENENAITINANITVGDKLIFCNRDGNKAAVSLDQMLERIKQKLNGAKPRGAIYHCSASRGKHLFGSNSQELKRIQACLDNVPLIGLFTAGEIYLGQTHNHSGVLTVFL